MNDLREERVFWREHFFGETFDFRSRILFWRFDGCVFVDCTFMIDHATEQLAFTECTLKDCSIDHIDADEVRGLIARDNFFDRPLNERKADFDRRLAAALSARKEI
ncbi:hypothetical protein HNQ36_005111 [Afipia massiliensis]|uniref:Pentapeptide repeat-containing protein n=1 Tax=Afipia massiliensis TaxID=211460 RepID=A0A840N7E3_9BRAD|nr:hypothetical protein [Afipia massiliensis]MBB5055100.1 hypothetical protein [Afipia massiliensis]